MENVLIIMKITDILVATNNEHKVKEFQQIFAPYGIKVHFPKELGLNIDPEENGITYYENALFKANAFAKFTRFPTIADDSGIEIDELGEHIPGIHSHRFMEEKGGQIPTLNFLTENHLNSKARFHCSIVLVNLEEKPLEFVGEVEGHISKIQKMADFGYDPVFFVDNLNKTYSELSKETKNKISHRALAAQNLINYLKGKHYI